MKTVFKSILLVAAVLVAGFAAAAVGHPLEPTSLMALSALGTINIAAGEKLAVVGTIDPQTVANTQLYTDVVDMQKHHQALFVALLGNMAAETIDFTLYYCDSDGNNAVELKDCTQLAAHASNNDNKQLVISLRAEELLAASKRYVKAGLVTGAGTGGPAAVLALGVDSRSQPASGDDLSSVVEIQL